MESLAPVLIRAIEVIASVVALTSAVVLIFSGIKLHDGFYEVDMSRRKRFLVSYILPILVYTRAAQPPENWKHIDRLCYSALGFAISFITLIVLQVLGVGSR